MDTINYYGHKAEVRERFPDGRIVIVLDGRCVVTTRALPSPDFKTCEGCRAHSPRKRYATCTQEGQGADRGFDRKSNPAGLSGPLLKPDYPWNHKTWRTNVERFRSDFERSAA